MLPVDNACVRELRPIPETSLVETALTSYLQNTMDKSFASELVKGHESISTEEPKLNTFLIELLKFPNSKRSKELLEQLAKLHLKDPVLEDDQKRPLITQRLDRSMSEPAHQPSAAKKLVNQARYKTELCRQYEEKGHCQYGDKCQFAHGRVEKRFVERHPKYKTEMCRTFHQQGFCSYGLRCNFIHNEDERRFAPVGESPVGSLTQGGLTSPLPISEGELLQLNYSSGLSNIHELTRSVSAFETVSESSAFSNDINVLLQVRELVESAAAKRRSPLFHHSGSESQVPVIAKDQNSRGRPILSRSASTAEPSLF